MLTNFMTPKLYHPISALETKVAVLERTLSEECSRAFIDPMKIDDYVDRILFLDKEIKRTRSALKIARKTRYSK